MMKLLDKEINPQNLIKEIERLAERLAVLERTAATGNLEDVMGRNQGYINGAWQKDPLRLGYSDILTRIWSNESLAAGANFVDDTVVPAGEIWVITNFALRYVGTVTSVYIRPCIYRAATTTVVLSHYESITSNYYYAIQGQFILEPGDALRIWVAAATLNDDAFGHAIGYKVDIDL